MKSVLITRPEPQASALSSELPPGWRGVISPLLEIVATGAEPDLKGIGGLVFTSVNGVRSVRDRLHGFGYPVWCVGERTGTEARLLGLQTRIADGDVGSLERLISAQNPKGRLLHIRGENSTGDLVSRLRAKGFEADDIVVYKQKPLSLSEEAKAGLQGGSLDAVLIFSPETARIFASQVDAIDLSGRRLCCLSQNVADALGAIQGARIETAARPDRAAILELLTR